MMCLRWIVSSYTSYLCLHLQLTKIKDLSSAIILKARKVRVQLIGTGMLSMGEVQVFDRNGANVALKKAATQSSTAEYPAGTPHPASKGVNGILTEPSVGTLTGYDAGKQIHSH
jgi:hypothetical protein